MPHAHRLRAASAALRSVGRGGLILAMILAGGATAGPDPVEDVGREVLHPGGSFSYQVPEGWKVGSQPERPHVVQLEGPTTLVRFVVRRGELGLDVAHVLCMDDRLAGPMETRPGVEYEEDFVTSVVSGRRTAYSSFVVTYDNAIMGHERWWQRNRTIVGGGETICVIGTMPDRVRRKKKGLRRTMEAVMDSVSFREAGSPER